MIEVREVSSAGVVRRPDASIQLPENGFLWINSDGLDPEADRALFRELVNAPDEVRAEALEPRHPPKFERWEGGSFLLLRGLDRETKDLHFGTIQIALFVLPGMLVTRHSGPSVSIEKVLSRITAAPDTAVTPGVVALEIAVAVIDRFLPIALAIENRLEVLEDRLAEQGDDQVLGELTSYRTALKRLRRITAFHQAAIGEMQRSEFVADKKGKRLIRECLENLDRLSSLQSLFHDLCGDLIDSYLALAAHRLNDIMRILTIVTAVFVPLGFLAGIYGMNFEYIPELGFRWGYFTLLSVMAGIVLTLLYLFRRNRWL